MQTPSLELTAGDFNAYLPERARSNVYSRPRLEFKQRAMIWARHVVQRLQQAQVQVVAHGSDEHPSVRNGFCVDSQWVYFLRDEEQRLEVEALVNQRIGIERALREVSPFHRHAFLAFRLDSEKIEVFAHLHPDASVDFETFQARWAAQERRQQIVESIVGLPQEFVFGLWNRESFPVESATFESLETVIVQMRVKQTALAVGWKIPREVALQHAHILDEQLEDALVSMVPVYQHLAWQPDDDPVQFAVTMEKQQADLVQRAHEREQQEREQQQQQAIARQEQTDKSRERTMERVQYDSARSRINLSNLFKTPAKQADSPRDGKTKSPFAHPELSRTGSVSSEVRRDADGDAVTATQPGGPGQSRRSARDDDESRGGKRSGGERPREFSSKSQVSKPKRPQPPEPTYISGGVVEPGGKVRVLSGPFRGKVGVLGEADGRGGVRVLLGLLSTRVLVDQLEAVVEVKDRPALQSSHRRDGLLGRSGK